ncbi:MAG: preprotein translocase subunit YajC [Deltaproteobacteria bacterium]|nr:preprotein translocase subunit YajC [Deltaproteobacteria bacterium]
MINPAWAQSAASGAPSPLVSFMPLILIFVVFYFLLIRPQQQKQKEHQVMLDNLKVNDEITTSGGIYGKVTAIADKVVTVEIAPNVRVRVERAQIGSLLRGGKDEKNQKEKDKPK